MLLLLALACSGPSNKDGADGPDTADTADTAPCTPVEAIFFDLGETLVTEQGDGKFATIPAVLDLLDALDAAGMPAGVITNVPAGYDREDLAALLVDPGLLDRFAVLLLSSEASSPPKPDPAIFAEAVALLPETTPSEQTAFVTEELDHLADADPPTLGAQAAGMIGVHLSSAAPSALADHTVPPEEMASLADAAWIECLEADQARSGSGLQSSTDRAKGR